MALIIGTMPIGFSAKSPIPCIITTGNVLVADFVYAFNFELSAFAICEIPDCSDKRDRSSRENDYSLSRSD